ncbi:tetratricopeptide repeat protein [Actinoplanes sp. NPDC026619]|uniref:tetratricopeptide repeat protein n=1 Tax=Actinoplanes sp. NPDC026619 TaxID=3155798 RepID=UPI0033FD4648
MLSSQWPQTRPQHVVVVDAPPVANQLPASDGRCGIYVLAFDNGQLYVGQARDVVRRFGNHRKTYGDITEMHFWRIPQASLDEFEQQAIRTLQAEGFLLRNVTHAAGRLGAGSLDSLVSAARQQEWFTSPESDDLGNEVRPDRAQVRMANQVRFERIKADPRLAAMLPAVRRYLARTVPLPRHTEFSRWSISAAPDTNKNSSPRIFTITVHSLETLHVWAPFEEQHRTIFELNVDLATMQRRWPDLGEMVEIFGAAVVQDTIYSVRPGVLRLAVEGARNFMLLLDLDGVVEAARRLNLDMMRKGAAMQWKSHSFALADLLLDADVEPVGSEDGDPLTRGLAADCLGDLRQAERCYLQAADGGNPEAAFRLGELYAEIRDDEEAACWYERAEGGGYHGVRRAAERANTYALMTYARHSAEDGDLSAAADYYQRAVYSGCTEAYAELGLLLEELGDTAEAEVAYRHAGEAGHGLGWSGLASLRMQVGDLEQAETLYKRAVDAGHLGSLIDLGLLHQQRDEQELAEANFRTAAKARFPYAEVLLGDIAAQRQDRAAAVKHYNRAIKWGHTDGLIGLGLLLENESDLAGAEIHYRQAADAGNLRALVNLAMLYVVQHDDERAEAYCREAVNAGHSDAFVELGDMLHGEGYPEASERYYRLAGA